jgi:hypothetical protein
MGEVELVEARRAGEAVRVGRVVTVVELASQQSVSMQLIWCRTSRRPR